ncbi:MAG: hypothetical protein D3906_03330, partial [Candidatus Electrothrix sp. AUS1_2]|nr:hypothetical protein [Candidatus Electrothrix sp. AUS1_2]
MRLIIAAALVLLGFFFVGLLNRAFAYSFCDPFVIDWSIGSQTSRESETFSTYNEAESYCIEKGGISGSCSSASINVCVSNPGYHVCWHTVSYGPQYFGASCENCSDLFPSPEEACLSPLNVTVDDKASCSYHCTCPDYAGESGYDFETCSVPDGSDPCMDQAISECGDLEYVVWDNVTTCSYHCDQGECEDEYLAAKQECDSPTLIDGNTCEYSCDCQDQKPAAQSECPYGYYMNYDTCTFACKCCDDLATECLQYCGSSDNISVFDCSDHTDAVGTCSIDSIIPCNCIVPPVDDTDPPSDPEPDPDDNSDDPGDGKTPDPDDDPDNRKTCTELYDACPSSCQFTCETDFDTGYAKYHNCDCNDDPADPGPDGVPGTEDDGSTGSADDGANGWLKQIEENGDKTASGIAEANGWLKAIKHNTDELLEDTDNIAENTRLSLENDKKYFSSDGRSVFKGKDGKSVFNGKDGKSVFVDGDGRSAFVNENGESYLRSISSKLNE